MPGSGKLYKIVTQGGKAKPRVIGFDRERGLGAALSENDVHFVRMMRPEHFLKIAAPIHNEELLKHGYVLRNMKHRLGWDRETYSWKPRNDGSPPNTIANPFLGVEWSDEHKAWDTKSHEGRHRSMFLARRGNPLIPVDIIVKGEYRRKPITSEMKKAPFLPQSYDLYENRDSGSGRHLGVTRYKPSITDKDSFIIKLPKE